MKSLTSIGSISTLVPSNATADKATIFFHICIHRNPKGKPFKGIGESQICPVMFFPFFSPYNLWIYFSLKWWKVNNICLIYMYYSTEELSGQESDVKLPFFFCTHQKIYNLKVCSKMINKTCIDTFKSAAWIDLNN